MSENYSATEHSSAVCSTTIILIFRVIGLISYRIIAIWIQRVLVLVIISPRNEFLQFLPQGQTTNRQYWWRFEKALCEKNAKICKKRPQLWRDNSWFLHHNNAPIHSALSIRKIFMPKISWLSSLDSLAPCVFFLFLILKSVPKIQIQFEAEMATNIKTRCTQIAITLKLDEM